MKFNLQRNKTAMGSATVDMHWDAYYMSLKLTDSLSLNTSDMTEEDAVYIKNITESYRNGVTDVINLKFNLSSVNPEAGQIIFHTSLEGGAYMKINSEYISSTIRMDDQDCKLNDLLTILDNIADAILS